MGFSDIFFNLPKIVKYLLYRYNIQLTDIKDALFELLIKTSLAYDPSGFELALYLILINGMAVDATPFNISFIPPDAVPVTFGVLTSKFPDRRSQEIIKLIAPSGDTVGLTALIYIVLTSPFEAGGVSRLDKIEEVARRRPDKVLDYVTVNLYRLFHNNTTFCLEPIVGEKAKMIIDRLRRDLVQDIVTKLPLAKLRYLATLYHVTNMPRIKIVVEEPIEVPIPQNTEGEEATAEEERKEKEEAVEEEEVFEIGGGGNEGGDADVESEIDLLERE